MQQRNATFFRAFVSSLSVSRRPNKKNSSTSSPGVCPPQRSHAPTPTYRTTNKSCPYRGRTAPWPRSSRTSPGHPCATYASPCCGPSKSNGTLELGVGGQLDIPTAWFYCFFFFVLARIVCTVLDLKRNLFRSFLKKSSLRRVFVTSRDAASFRLRPGNLPSLEIAPRTMLVSRVSTRGCSFYSNRRPHSSPDRRLWRAWSFTVDAVLASSCRSFSVVRFSNKLVHLFSAILKRRCAHPHLKKYMSNFAKNRTRSSPPSKIYVEFRKKSYAQRHNACGGVQRHFLTSISDANSLKGSSVLSPERASPHSCRGAIASAPVMKAFVSYCCRRQFSHGRLARLSQINGAWSRPPPRIFVGTVSGKDPTRIIEQLMGGDSSVLECPPLKGKVEWSIHDHWGNRVALLGQERAPQPPRQEALLRLLPAANCR